MRELFMIFTSTIVLSIIFRLAIDATDREMKKRGYNKPTDKSKEKKYSRREKYSATVTR